MTLNTNELIKAVIIVAENEQIQVTVKSSMKGSAIVAGTTFVGGMLVGSRGILGGAALGGLLAYFMTEGTFKSLPDVILEMSDDQKKELCGHIKEAFRNFGLKDLELLIPMLSSNVSFRKIVIGQIKQFVEDRLMMQIID